MSEGKGRSFGRFAILGPWGTLYGLLIIVVAIALVVAAPAARALGWQSGSLGYFVMGVASSAALLGLIVVLPMRSHMKFEDSTNLEQRLHLMAEAERQEFEARLHRALEAADNETEAMEVVQRAVRMATPMLPFELLLADSSRAHLTHAAAGGPHGEGPGCQVDSPWSCQAVRRGQTIVFESDDELDSCPKLRGRSSGGCSAVCVPVTIMGRAMGVLHATAAPEEPPDPGAVARLESVAIQAGSRVALLRAMERSQLQASTDPLTGLLNRRSLEAKVRTLQQQGRLFAVAMADLDHFKRLNDTFGHETGDRALRLFSRTMQGTVRPDDIVCRLGGEEFVIVLPDCTADDAVPVLERIQTMLSGAVASGTVPVFTVSFGVADSLHADNLFGLLQLSDGALIEAKQSGRNRIIVSHDVTETPNADQVSRFAPIEQDGDEVSGLTDPTSWAPRAVIEATVTRAG